MVTLRGTFGEQVEWEIEYPDGEVDRTAPEPWGAENSMRELRQRLPDKYGDGDGSGAC